MVLEHNEGFQIYFMAMKKGQICGPFETYVLRKCEPDTGLQFKHQSHRIFSGPPQNLFENYT